MKAYERQLEVMQITGMKKKTAMKFIEGLQLIEKEDGAVVQFLTAVPFFKVSHHLYGYRPIAAKVHVILPLCLTGHTIAVRLCISFLEHNIAVNSGVRREDGRG